MKLQSNPFEAIPIDMVVELLLLLLSDGFSAFYNFLKLWAQTQRGSVVRRLFEELPLRWMYGFAGKGSPADAAAFHQFMHVAANLGFVDAIVYESCRNAIYNVGSSHTHLSRLDQLAGGGDFLSMVGSFMVKGFTGQHTSVSALQGLLDLHRYPHYSRDIGPAVDSITLIWSTVGAPHIVHGVDRRSVCTSHSLVGKQVLVTDYGDRSMCPACDVACMLNMFTRAAAGN